MEQHVVKGILAFARAYPVGPLGSSLVAGRTPHTRE